MEGSFQLTLQIIIAVLAGITAQVVGQYFQLPSIVFLLLLGIFLGQDCLNILHPSQLGVGLEVLVALSVAIILFEGGLNLELRDLGKVSGSLRNLVTLGTLITLIGGGIAAHFLGEFPWSIAFLYASLVVVTGPTVIGPLLKQVSVDKKVATLLEGEGVLIDPVGAILAVVVLDTILNVDAVPLEIITGLAFRLGIGTIIGVLGGWLMSLSLKKANFLSEDLTNLVVLAGVWGLFGFSQSLLSESGLMATVIAGIVVKASSLPEERMLRRFKGQLTVLCVSVLFILLAADLSIPSVFALGWGSLGTVLTLMFIIRPISIVACTLDSDLSWRQKLFLAWIAPKGIVSASVASLFAILLTEKGVNGGDSIKALVFLTIMMTVFCQGLTAGLVAKWLNISSNQATGAVIIGCNPLSRLIASIFQREGESVVLIDTDAEACQQAESENLPVFQSSGLNPDALEEAGIESMGTLLVLTSNGQINLVLAQRALEEFSLPRVFSLFPAIEEDEQNEQKITRNSKINSVFVNESSLKIWNNYLNQGQIKLGQTLLRSTDFSFQKAHLQALIRAGELLPLLYKREGRLQVFESEQEWLAGDEIIYLFHDPRPELLKRLSGSFQAKRLSLEKLSEVEEIPIAEPLPEKNSGITDVMKK